MYSDIYMRSELTLVYMYIHTHIINIYMYSELTLVYIYIYTHIIYIYMYIYMCIYIHTHTHIYIYIYILEKGMATHFSILAGRIPMDGSAWQAIVHRVAKRWA